MNLATKLFLTLAIGIGAAVVVADNRAMECRADYLGDKRGLARLLSGQMIDEIMSAAIDDAMKYHAIPGLIQPLARPFFEAEALCHLAEESRK